MLALGILFYSLLPQLRDNWKQLSHFFFNVALPAVFNRYLLQNGKTVLFVLDSWSVVLHSLFPLFIMTLYLVANQ